MRNETLKTFLVLTLLVAGLAEASLAQQSADADAPVPSQATLVEPMKIEIVRDGRPVGSTTIKEGTKVQIERIEEGRALLKGAAAGTWALLGSEWEATTLMEGLVDRDAVLGGSISLDGGLPKVAWMTEQGMWFAEKVGNEWRINLVDSFAKDFAKAGFNNSRDDNCLVFQLKDGSPVIAYRFQRHYWDLDTPAISEFKIAQRSGVDWRIQRLQGSPEDPKKPLAAGLLNGEPAIICNYGHYVVLVTQNSPQSWFYNRLAVLPENSVPTEQRAAAISWRGTAAMLATITAFGEPVPTTTQLASLDARTATFQQIEPVDSSELGVAFSGQHTLATYLPTNESRRLCISTSAGGWNIRKLNGNVFGQEARLVRLCARKDGVASMLFSPREGHALHAEFVSAQLTVVEELQAREAFDMALDAQGRPTVLLVTSDGRLQVMTRTKPRQLGVDSGKQDIVKAVGTSTKKSPDKVTTLPEASYPGSESERARILSALGEPQKFTLTLPSGEAAEFTRWGSGDRAVVFFNEGHTYGRNGIAYSVLHQEVMANAGTYLPLLQAGYSIIVWPYPQSEAFFPRYRKEGDGSKPPSLSGIASAVVTGVRQNTGISEIVLVGQKQGARVLLADLATLREDANLRLVLSAVDLRGLEDLPPAAPAVIYFDGKGIGREKDWLLANCTGQIDQLTTGFWSLSHSVLAEWLLAKADLWPNPPDKPSQPKIIVPPAPAPLESGHSGPAQHPASERVPGATAVLEVAKPQETLGPPISQVARVDSAAAAAHIGQTVIVRGNVATVRGSSRTGMTYINFGKPYPDMEFAASFDSSNAGLANLRELEGHQGVEIEGTISADGSGRPHIVITSLDQVKSRGEPKAQGTSTSGNDVSGNSTGPTSSSPSSGGLSPGAERMKNLRVVSVADLTADVAKSLQQDGAEVVFRGRLIGVTAYGNATDRYTLWLTSAGAKPSVSVKPAAIDGRVITPLEQIGNWVGREIEVPVVPAVREGIGAVHLEAWSTGEPRLFEPQSAPEPAAKFDPLAVFSSLTRLTVSELRKVDFPKPDDKGRLAITMGLSTEQPIVVVGRLRSVFKGEDRTDFLMTSHAEKPSVRFTVRGEVEELGELQKLEGHEIAVVPEHVFSFGGANGIEIEPVTFLYNGRPRVAAFSAKELGRLISGATGP